VRFPVVGRTGPEIPIRRSVATINSTSVDYAGCFAVTSSSKKGGVGENYYETPSLKHMPPACARQATGNSVGPKVELRSAPAGILLAVRDVGELQTPTRFQDPHHFSEDPALVGAPGEDAVANDDIGRAVLERQVLDHALRESARFTNGRIAGRATSSKDFSSDANPVSPARPSSVLGCLSP